MGDRLGSNPHAEITPVVAPSAYSAADFAFIVSRVLELTYSPEQDSHETDLPTV